METFFHKNAFQHIFSRKCVPNRSWDIGSNSPSTVPETTIPKTSEGERAAIKAGVQGACPRPSFSPFLGRNGDPRRAGGAPGALRPKAGKRPAHPKGTQYRAAPGRWSGLGPPQDRTCEVVSRPVPGGGSRLSLEKARTQRVAGEGPAPPFFNGPLVGTRSFWRLCRIVPVEGLLRYPCTCPDLDSHFAGAGVAQE